MHKNNVSQLLDTSKLKRYEAYRQERNGTPRKRAFMTEN
jgi:hypothetical protein